ncbi:MAG: helix-turn-helix transcriptional regulator [Clostridia bacterium]|nr:helix-turn-helix transcriptional regulator [Clostridia bacterium]
MLINSVFSYGRGFTPATWGFLNHRPTFSRVYYILGGTAYYRDGEREFRLMPGLLYILPADCVYSIWEDSDDKLDHLYLHLLTTPKISAPIVRDPEKEPLLFDLLTLIQRYITGGDHAAVRRLTEALVLYVTDEHDRAGDLSLRIRAHLDENFRAPFSTEALSRRFGYSPSYLYKVFKHDFGVSPKRYYADRRFEYAAARLADGAPITEISETLSYSSLANFSRDFKKRFGLSPGEYARWLPTGKK